MSVHAELVRSFLFLMFLGNHLLDQVFPKDLVQLVQIHI